MGTRHSNELLLAITQCSEIPLARNSSHPCHKIVNCQKDLNEFQLPEPWTGDISSAPILFISSNPSINEEEAYPTVSWNEDEVSDFFENRFEENAYWTRDARYVLLKNRKEYNHDWVRFWASVRKRSEELLGRSATPGRDYAMTEVVHCKSREEAGVTESISICSKKWIEPIMSHSNAKIVVLLGNRARDVCCNFWDIDPSLSVHFDVLLGRYLIRTLPRDARHHHLAVVAPRIRSRNVVDHRTTVSGRIQDRITADTARHDFTKPPIDGGIWCRGVFEPTEGNGETDG